MAEKKSDILKNIMINLGVLLILVGSTAMKGDLTFFVIGLVLLALQTFEFAGVKEKKLALSEIMLSATVAIGAAIQLIVSAGTRSQQAFLIMLLLGGLLMVVEAVRKYADL